MKKPILLLGLATLLAACSDDKTVELAVANPAGGASLSQLAAVPAAPILERLGADYVYVADASGREIPSQITYDGLLLFPADVAAGSESIYTVGASDTCRVYPRLASGRLYPERADDIAWENEAVGFRIYGPATQAKGERAFGYDIFFKHRSDDAILPVLYKDETDPAVWARVDSLRAIDPKLAQDYIDSFSYHIDHGLGMDCYAVGPTLGDGVAAFVENDSILFAWCYDKAIVLDNGPLRFTVKLDFAPRAIGSDSTVVEHRVISLDAGSYLNRQSTWFDGLPSGRKIAAGMPVREGGTYEADAPALAVTDLTQGPDNGTALLGVIMPGAAASENLVQGHAILMKDFAPTDTLTHHWGFAWDREAFGTMEAWSAHLSDAAKAAEKPLIVTIK